MLTHPAVHSSTSILCVCENYGSSKTAFRPLVCVGNKNIVFLFPNQNICCGYSIEPSQRDGSFEHPKHMLK